MSETSDATDALAAATQLLIGTRNEWIDWATGTANGGPSNDGNYPITAGDGTVVLVPCPAKIPAALPFRYPLASAVDRFVSDALSDFVVSANAAGAVGDGVTNDTAAVQALINELSAAGGGVIMFRPGRYSLNVVLKSNVVLMGQSGGWNRGTGQTFDAGSTRYVTQFRPAGPGLIVDTIAGSSSTCGIVGIDFFGNYPANTAGGARFRAGGNYGCFTRGCSFINFGDEALWHEGLGWIVTDVFAGNSLMTRARAARTGTIRLEGADGFAERLEGNTGITDVFSANLYLCGIYIGGSNNYFDKLMGELSEIGVFVGGTGGIHKGVNSRADRNFGHGWWIEHAIVSNCHALSNSRNADNVYSGFVIGKSDVRLDNCYAQSLGGDARHKYGFLLDAGAQSASLPRAFVSASCGSIGHGTARINDTLFDPIDATIGFGPLKGSGATPNIEGTSYYIPQDASAVTITDFLGGKTGQILVVDGNANVTIQHSAAINLNTGANKTLVAGRAYVFLRQRNGSTPRWVETGDQGSGYFTGPTASRPTTGNFAGRAGYDNTLNRPIWRNASNTNWVDATGAVV